MNAPYLTLTTGEAAISRYRRELWKAGHCRAITLSGRFARQRTALQAGKGREVESDSWAQARDGHGLLACDLNRSIRLSI